MKLSICIPTYNFGAFIGETLRSILDQKGDDIEVVVLDSNSSDDTPNIVQSLQAAHPCLRYTRANAKCGIDRDMAKVVSLSRGEFCWLMSADDTMRPGALRRMQEVLANGPSDLLICAHSNCTRDMQVINSKHPTLSGRQIESFELSVPEERARYFSRALSTEAFFSFISGLVIRKSTWDSIDFNEQFAGSCWAHVARFFELCQTGLAVTHLPEVLVDRRGENDSFLTQGLVRRYSLAIDGYRELVTHFFGAESVEAIHVRRVLRHEFPLRCLLGAKAVCEDGAPSDSVLLDQLVTYLYQENTAINFAKRVTYKACPGSTFIRARAIYRNIRRRNAVSN